MSVLYCGPMNALVRRLKWFSVSTLVLTIAAIPTFMVYEHPRMTRSARIGMLTGIVTSSVASSVAFHAVAGRYVLKVMLSNSNQGSNIVPSTRLLISTLSFWGRERTLECALSEIQSVERGLCTWKLLNPPKSLFLAIPRPGDPLMNENLQKVVSCLRESEP